MLEPSVNRPNEAIFVHRWALRGSHIACHPRLGKRVPVGPLRSGNIREKKSAADMYREYKWRIPDGYDPAREGDKPGVRQPLKNWASHPMDALTYIVREIWGYVAEGMRPL